MTDNPSKERKALMRLADALVEDILSTPDEDILAEFQETGGDPEFNAAEMRDLFERGMLIANKRRLADAKAGAAASRGTTSSSAMTDPVDINVARARLRGLLAKSGTLTLAARKESELSDNDILGMLEDLRELGIISDIDDVDDKR